MTVIGQLLLVSIAVVEVSTANARRITTKNRVLGVEGVQFKGACASAPVDACGRCGDREGYGGRCENGVGIHLVVFRVFEGCVVYLGAV